MKKFAFFLVVGTSIATQGHSQTYSARNGEYVGAYYSPVIYGPNGFRTVEEENRLMAETLAELKRQHQKEDATQEEIARSNKKREEEVATQKKMFGAGKKEESNPKK
jgi:hypothetical protein